MPRRADRGLTLIELLTVIIIFSIVLGFSITMFRGARQDLGVGAASNQAVGLLRGAREAARGRGVPAWVMLDLRERTISRVIAQTVGEWHFEGPGTEGAFGRDAKIQGGTLVPGRVGQGIRLGGSGTIDCGPIPVLAPDQGMVIEFWVRREAARGRSVICSVGKDVEIFSEADGRIGGRVGNLQVSSGNRRLPVDLWCRIQMIHSGREVRLILNGETAERKTGTAGAASGGTLVVGDRRGGLAGIVDEVRLGVIVAGDVAELPPEVSIEFPKGREPQGDRYVIAFEPGGNLDPQSHAEPVRFSLVTREDRRELTVGLGGTVERARPGK